MVVLIVVVLEVFVVVVEWEGLVVDWVDVEFFVGVFIEVVYYVIGVFVVDYGGGVFYDHVNFV